MVSIAGTAILAFTLKLGSLIPEGSTYMNIANQFKRDIESYTQGKVRVIWYAGGVMGDEPEMIRKIRMGQLHGGGFTGYGLGIIDGVVRMFELPGLFKSYDEFFAVAKVLEPEVKQRFREKGFELLVMFPVGFVYIFSQKEIRTLADFNGVKLWVWSGDPVAAEIAQALKGYAQLINLSVGDVITGLQTGMINSFYNMPYAAVSLQWTNYVKYLLDYPISLAIGGVVISMKAMERLTEDQRRFLEETVQKRFQETSRAQVQENEKALEELKKKGMKFTRVDEDSPEIKRFLELFKKTHEKFKGEMYPPQMYEKLVKMLEDYRKRQGNPQAHAR